MSYFFVRNLHIACVVLSLAGFALRGAAQFAGWRLPRALRPLPHIVDSVLLASALMLAAMSRQWPFLQPWLTAKFFALLAYIALGSIALDVRRPSTLRGAAYLAALTTATYLVAVAITRSPWLAMA